MAAFKIVEMIDEEVVKTHDEFSSMMDARKAFGALRHGEFGQKLQPGRVLRLVDENSRVKLEHPEEKKEKKKRGAGPGGKSKKAKKNDDGDDDDGDDGDAPRPKKAKKEEAAKGPKKLSGYMYYQKEHRVKVKAELEAEGLSGKELNTTIVSRIAANWKALSDDDKQKWKDTAPEIEPKEKEKPKKRAPKKPAKKKAKKDTVKDQDELLETMEKDGWEKKEHTRPNTGAVYHTYTLDGKTYRSLLDLARNVYPDHVNFAAKDDDDEEMEIDDDKEEEEENEEEKDVTDDEDDPRAKKMAADDGVDDDADQADDEDE